MRKCSENFARFFVGVFIFCSLTHTSLMQRRGGWGNPNAGGGRAMYISSQSSTTPILNFAGPAQPVEKSVQYTAEEAQKLIPGLRVIKDFISKEEEEELLKVSLLYVYNILIRGLRSLRQLSSKNGRRT